MNDLQKTRRIGIFGHVGNENLGDEAIIAAVIQNIKLRYPEVELYGFTLNPEDTQKRHKIPAFPIRRIQFSPRASQSDKTNVQKTSFREKIKAKLKLIPFIYYFLKFILKFIRNGYHIPWSSLKELKFLITCYKNLKGIDLLIVAGSQQLIDFIGGPWLFPYTHLKWSIIARMVQTKVAFVSVGAGPIYSPLSRLFIKYALSRARYRSYREEISKQLIEQLNVPGQNSVFPDLVYSLRIEARPPSKSLSGPRPIVGLNPVPFNDPQYWPGSTAHLYRHYVRQLADFALWLIQRGYAVLFFPTQLRLDPPVIDDIRAIMEANSVVELSQYIVDCPIHSFDDLISAILTMDIVVATRFHGIIIPYVLNKPVLGIAYHKKTHDLMRQMGQSDHVLDIGDIHIDSLQKKFISLESQKTAIRKEIEQRILGYRNSLEDQYNQLFELQL